MTKRLEAVGVDSSAESRRSFRGLMFTARGAADHISGVIMYEETSARRPPTARRSRSSWRRRAPARHQGRHRHQAARGLPQETVTEGLDGLRERLGGYRELGARFAKWRAVIKIGAGLPTRGCIDTNAHALARYAALCQEAGVVPIVEPEVLMEGDHTIDRSEEVTAAVLRAVFGQLAEQRVLLEGIVLKPNMVLSGYDCPELAGVEEVAERTLSCFRRVVPAAVPGVAFLSGGQSDELAAAHLNAMNTIEGVPWELSFSYGRALVGAPLKVWAGDATKIGEAQAALLHRARCNCAARRGEYTESMEGELVA